MPATSVTTGWVCGSQFATDCPALTMSASFTVMVAPYGNLVALTLAAELIHHAQFAGTRHRDQVPSLVAYRLDVVQANRALALDFDAVGRSRPRSRAADVEGAHGQLRARLADRLRGDDADRLADVDAMPAPQIAAIALRANAVAGFAGDGRTHHDLIDAHLFQELDQFFVDQDAGLDQHLAARGDHHILGYHAAQHALAQAFNHIAAFDDRGDGQAVDRAAVDLGDHQVLRHVDQATGQSSRSSPSSTRCRPGLYARRESR